MEPVFRIEGKSPDLGKYNVQVIKPNDGDAGVFPNVRFECNCFRFDGEAQDFSCISRVLMAQHLLSGNERCVFLKGTESKPYEAEGLLLGVSEKVLWELDRLIVNVESGIQMIHMSSDPSFRIYAGDNQQIVLLGSRYGSTWGASIDLQDVDFFDPCEIQTFLVPSAKDLSYAAMLDLFPGSRDWLFDCNWIQGMPRDETETLVKFESFREDLSRFLIQEVSRNIADERKESFSGLSL